MHIIWKDTAEYNTYEEARVGRVFNHRRPDRFPLAVVKASSEDDIVAAVKLAAERNCRIAVRSGGHSWAAWSVRDNSILIDLGNYKELEVDAESRIARATPSMTGRELNSVLTSDYGLMFPGGHCPDVGLGGFLLQGGMGWNCRVGVKFHGKSDTVQIAYRPTELGLGVRASSSCGCCHDGWPIDALQCMSESRSLLGCSGSWTRYVLFDQQASGAFDPLMIMIKDSLGSSPSSISA